MERRWLFHRHKDLEQRLVDRDVQRAVADWREFRTRVEEHTIRRQHPHCSVEPFAEDVMTVIDRLEPGSDHYDNSKPADQQPAQPLGIREKDIEDRVRLKRWKDTGRYSSDSTKGQSEGASGGGAAGAEAVDLEEGENPKTISGFGLGDGYLVQVRRGSI